MTPKQRSLRRSHLLANRPDRAQPSRRRVFTRIAINRKEAGQARGEEAGYATESRCSSGPCSDDSRAYSGAIIALENISACRKPIRSPCPFGRRGLRGRSQNSGRYRQYQPEFLYMGCEPWDFRPRQWMTMVANAASTIDLDRLGQKPRALIDPFQRAITYLRVSVTDRCDFRCVYCMAEHMTFLPKADLLSLEELDRLCSAFVAKGVTKLRLTGGEPLVRRGIMTLVRSLSRHLASGALEELTLTTNGSQLQTYATELKAYGINRINVSLDTLDAESFAPLRAGVI